MPTLTEKIQKTQDQIEALQGQGNQLENEIKQLNDILAQKKQQYAQMEDQFRHLHTRLATLREIAEPETHDSQSNEGMIEGATGHPMPPEVLEQVKNVLADAPTSVEEEKQPAPTHVHKGHRKKEHK